MMQILQQRETTQPSLVYGVVWYLSSRHLAPGIIVTPRSGPAQTASLKVWHQLAEILFLLVQSNIPQLTDPKIPRLTDVIVTFLLYPVHTCKMSINAML